MSTIKKNFIYTIIQYLLMTILPIITAPYVSRILLPNNLGIYSYTNTIAYCFVLASMLGIKDYGNRTISKSRDNKKELSKNFLSIYTIQILSSLVAIIFYLLYITIFENQYYVISLLQLIYLSSCLFDVEWFFLGLEKFKLTAPVSICMKIISIICIFLFVKDYNSLWIYTFINVVAILIEKIILFCFLTKEINFVKINFLDIKKHLKPMLALFIPVISVGIYKQIDKVMLGLLSNVSEVSYYEQAEKIVSMPMQIVTTLGLVMLPKISYLVVKKQNKLIFDYIEKAIKFTMFLILPICFGIIAISSDLVLVLLGDAFFKTIHLIRILSITTIFISFASVIRRQYILPFEKDSIYIKSVIIGAILDFTLNLFLIPIYDSTGACISTVIVEFMVMFIQIWKIKKELPLKQYFLSSIPFFLKTLVMFLIVIFIKKLGLNPLVTILLQMFCGALVYFGMNIKYIKSLLLKTNKNINNL